MKLNKIMLAGLALCAGLAFTSCQDDRLDPNPMAGTDVKLASFGPSMLVRLDTMQIFGAKLDKVEKVIFQAAEVAKSEFVLANAEEIDVVIPYDARPGLIGLLAGKDTVWSKTPMVFSEPIKINSVTPANGIMPGTDITIAGEYVYNIASVEFQVGQIVKAADFKKCEREEVVVTVPMGAVAGEAVFTDGADWVEKINLDILGASYEKMSADSLDFGEQLVIEGTNLNLVEKVTFAGNILAEDFVVASDNKKLTVAVPADAAPGVITLTQYSLVSLTTDTLKLPVISVTGVSPKTDLGAGMTVTVTGALLNRVVRVEVGGGVTLAAGQFEVNAEGTELTFVAPEGMADGKVKLIQNANLSAETDLVKMRRLGNLFYTIAGGCDLDDGWGTWFQVAYNNDVQQVWRGTLTEPGKLTVNVEQHEGYDYCCIQMQHITAAGWGDPVQVDLAAGQTAAQFTLTQDDIDLLMGDGTGLVFGGHGAKLLSFEWESSSAPVALWEGDAEVNWNNAVTIASADILANAGKTLYITYNATDGDYHMIRIINNTWGFNPENDDNWNLSFGAGESGVWEKVISEELITNLAGGDLSLTGFGCHITKVAVK